MKIDVKEGVEETVTKVKTIPSVEKRRNKRINDFLITGLALVAVVIIIFIALVSRQSKVDDSYFVSDENKDVINLEVSEADSKTTNLKRTHIVYNYENDKITSLKTYYEYENNELASQALENTKNLNRDAESVVLDDKYIVVTDKSDKYEKLTPSDIKQQAEAIRKFQESQKKAEKN